MWLKDINAEGSGGSGIVIKVLTEGKKIRRNWGELVLEPLRRAVGVGALIMTRGYRQV